ncbi:MAG: glycosyltransferase family 4 protein [Acidobacteria bacterium]|nr:glycosyltransferase family 4 protein [Acidobacteriota bacterium]MBI3423859.1 glycosyltransferase family 4 protein [Acidobacteriota bacterium]
MHLHTAPPNADEIGYVLKSYPRTSETFIANEIYLLERLGLNLRLFSILDLADPQRHAVVEATRAPIHYLPQLSSLSEVPFPAWLRLNAPQFFASHWPLFKARPVAYVQTLLTAVQRAFKHRQGSWRQPATSFFKEFLQAGFIAQQVLAQGTLRHLHAHFCHTATTVTMFASQLCGVPFSFTAHAKDIYVQALNPGDLLPTKLRRAKFAVTCTQANRTHLKALGVTETPIYTVYHGLDTRQFAPRAATTEEPEIPVVLTVGRVVEKKGFPFLIEACRLLKARGLRFQCRFISGAGVREQEITALIHELGLDDTVLMQPAVTQETLRQIYQQATLFALPCQIAENNDRDGIPNVLVEAMASGLPVVSTGISGIPELIEHGVSGWLVPPKDARALADAIVTLLAAPELRQRLGQAARAKVCRLFEAEANVRTLQQLFLDCLKSVEERGQTASL